MAATVLIMAAGRGTRMHSELPKVLHTVCGRPLVAWPAIAARKAGAERVCVITSPGLDLSSALPEGVETVVQPEADGTGGALRAALAVVREAEDLVVLSGDHPLVDAATIESLLATHREAGAGATVMTVELTDPGSYGRIVRGADAAVAEIVETKHPEGVPEEVLAIREVNTGTYAFDAEALASALERIGNDNEAGEYYLGDVLPLIRESGRPVAAHLAADGNVSLGVNDRAELACAEAEARRSILRRHMLAGVTVVDPESTWVDADVEIEADVRIEPATRLAGATRIGAGSVIGPQTTLIDSVLGPETTVPHSHLVECEVAAGCAVGPFAHLRPGTRLERGAKAGSFVEIKNSRIGAGAKVPHLSYVGDTEVGERANLGASTITANYDGHRKHRTKIGQDARTGVHTSLVAPVTVGDDAYTAAGSAIAEDVPDGALGIARPQQTNVDGYAERKRRENPEEEGS